MKSDSPYYMLVNKDASVKARKRWYAEAQCDGRICPGCGYVRTSEPLGPVEVERLPKSKGCFRIFGLLRQAYHKDLVDLLAELSQLNPIVSELIMHGERAPNHVVPWFGPQVPVRGSAKSLSDICKECERLSIYVEPPFYVLSGSFQERSVFSTQFGVIAVSKSVCDLIRARKFTGISYEPLGVLDKPVDGFAELDFEKRYKKLPRRKHDKEAFDGIK